MAWSLDAKVNIRFASRSVLEVRIKMGRRLRYGANAKYMTFAPSPRAWMLQTLLCMPNMTLLFIGSSFQQRLRRPMVRGPQFLFRCLDKMTANWAMLTPFSGQDRSSDDTAPVPAPCMSFWAEKTRGMGLLSGEETMKVHDSGDTAKEAYHLKPLTARIEESRLVGTTAAWEGEVCCRVSASTSCLQPMFSQKD